MQRNASKHRKNWHILQINPEFRNVFVNKPAIEIKIYKTS